MKTTPQYLPQAKLHAKFLISVRVTFVCVVNEMNKIISVPTQLFLLGGRVYVSNLATCLDLNYVIFRLLQLNKHIVEENIKLSLFVVR